jgi:hypothetical protein
MMHRMKSISITRLAAGIAAIVLQPALLLAQTDSRLEGYLPNAGVVLPESSTTITWIIMAVLLLACAGVMFKDAKRLRAD